MFPSPDLGNNKKCSMNEIPQELKFTLVFDEYLEGPDLKKNKTQMPQFSDIKEEIESDEEDELEEIIEACEFPLDQNLSNAAENNQ